MAKKLMKGNEAVAEAAVRAGCRFFAGYPITPQSEIPEYLSGRLPQVGGVFIQGESEVASINMVYGAASTGIRCLTSSSGLGFSLKSEGISYMAGALLPAVYINVARGGPGLGTIQPAQQDFLQATHASGHGGFKMIVKAPHTVQEAVDMVYGAWDLAERDRNPVMILMDGCLGTVMEEVELPPMRELPEKHPQWAVGHFDEAEPGRPRHMVSSILGEQKVEMLNKRAAGMYKKWEATEVDYERYLVDDAEFVVCAYGISARVARYAINALREEGIKIGMIRPKTVYPFPRKAFKELDYSQVKAVIDLEMAIPAQMYDDIQLGVLERCPILTYGHSGGVLLNNEETIAALRELIGGLK